GIVFVPNALTMDIRAMFSSHIHQECLAVSDTTVVIEMQECAKICRFALFVRGTLPIVSS
ncbi:hypothetical protein ACWGRJ_47185, partial [Bradyrhizobium sp. Lot11]